MSQKFRKQFISYVDKVKEASMRVDAWPQWKKELFNIEDKVSNNFPIDFEDIEKRILAGENLDIHKEVASKLFNVPVSHVTKDQRQAAKIANFGVLYGPQSWKNVVSKAINKED